MKGEKWRYALASVIGAAHLNQETECQDRMFCDVFEKNGEELLIAAISDGAGSTTSGQVGAEIACETFAAEIKAFLQSTAASIKSINEDFGKQWLAYFQKKIEGIALENEKPVRDYASTFIGAVVGKSNAAFFQIGDGAVVYTAETAGSYQFGIETPESEYMNMTDFLIDANAADKLQFKLIEEKIEDLILFSDGIYPVAINYQTGRPHEPFFTPMLAPLRNGNPAAGGLNEKLESFLSSSKINEKTDDDKTLILASRHKARGDS